MAEGRGFEGIGGGIAAEDGDDFVAGEQFFDGGGGFALFRLDVFDEVFDFAAEDAAGGVEFLDGETDAFAGGETEGGFFTGEGGEMAELDGFGGGGRSGGEGEKERE